MKAPSFDVIKKNLADFDQQIIADWEVQLMLNGDGSNFFTNYLADIPDFPPDEKALIAPEGSLTMGRIVLDADPGEDVDMNITLETMRKKFAFAATPCERPQSAKPKKKKGKKKKSKSSDHGKRAPGKTPRSESTTFKKK